MKIPLIVSAVRAAVAHVVVVADAAAMRSLAAVAVARRPLTSGAMHCVHRVPLCPANFRLLSLALIELCLRYGLMTGWTGDHLS